MRTPTYLPNLLSSLRIALAPAVLGAAYSNSAVGFAILLAVALATDALDGFLARRWGSETPLGRRLDRWGDGLTTTAAIAGVGLIWPQVVSREWRWMLVAAGGYLLIGIERVTRAPLNATPPGWVAKTLGAASPLSLVPLLVGWTPWPFRIAAILQLGIGVGKFFKAPPGLGFSGGRAEAGPAKGAGLDWLPARRRSDAKT